MKILRTIASLIVVSSIALFPGCSAKTGNAEAVSGEATSAVSAEGSGNAIGRYLEGRDTFEVTSEDLVDGVWPDIISYTHIGENRSPQLSWQPVDGANVYVIYMVDSITNGFLHWKSNGITETELPCGWAPKLTEYNGPHLGHGYTHTFDIYVIALKAPVERLRGAINGANPKLDSFIQELDTDIDGNTGNIISYGKISGEFTDARYRNT